MANSKIILKKSSVAAKVPLTTDLEYGELAINYEDGKLYFKTAANAITSFNTSLYIGTTLVSVNRASASQSLTGVSIDGSAANWTTARTISLAGDVSGSVAIDGSANVSLTASVGPTTGSGNFVKDTSPTLVTPIIGVATATSINKVTITAPATSATLTIANGKTFTANASLTLAGTDATTMTFPSTSATIARIDAAQSFTGAQTFLDSVTMQTSIGTISIGTSQSTGTVTIGSAAQIGSITIGRSTDSQTVDIANGAVVSGKTKTVYIAYSATASSTSNTLMYVGPTSAPNTLFIGQSTVNETLWLSSGSVATASTKAVNIGTGSGTGVTNITIGPTATSAGSSTLIFGQSARTETIQIGTGASASGITKLIQIGTNGAAGSTTTITVGSTAGTSTTTLNGAVTLASTINKVTITAPATSATLTIANTKTFTVNNTLTFTGTDASSVAFGTGGTVIYSGGALGTPSSGTLTSCTGLPVGGISATGTPSSTTYLRGDGTWSTVSAGSSGITIGTTTITSGTSGRVLYNNAGVVGELATTGSGNIVLATSATLTTPILSGSISASAAIFDDLRTTVSASVTAGTNSKTLATALTSYYNIVTSTPNNPSGVALPTATSGKVVVIINKGTNPLAVYTVNGGTAVIDSLATTASYPIPVGEGAEFTATTSGQWYSNAIYSGSTSNLSVGSATLATTATNQSGGTVAATTATFSDVMQYTSTHGASVTTAGTGTVDLNLSAADHFITTATGALVFTLSNIPSSGRLKTFMMRITNGGAQTIVWPTGIKWPGGTAPGLTTSGIDILSFIIDDATNIRGTLIQKDSK